MQIVEIVPGKYIKIIVQETSRTQKVPASGLAPRKQAQAACFPVKWTLITI